MGFSKEEIRSQLKESICRVVFTKADGSERVMRCTLLDDIIRPFIEEIEKRNSKLILEGKTPTVRAENPNLLSVIDLDVNSWRSFKIDSIKSIEVVE